MVTININIKAAVSTEKQIQIWGENPGKPLKYRSLLC